VTTVAATAAAIVMTAVATIAAAAAISATAEQQTEGRSLALTANQGDADQGEKDRHTQHNNAIHPLILQLLTGTGKREQHVAVISVPHLAARRPEH
jgi:hypothetical protein